MADDRPIALPAISYVWIAGTLALLASAPALFARGLVADDWTVYYAFWTEGAASVARMMWQVAHGGYAIPITPESPRMSLAATRLPQICFCPFADLRSAA